MAPGLPQARPCAAQPLPALSDGNSPVWKGNWAGQPFTHCTRQKPSMYFPEGGEGESEREGDLCGYLLKEPTGAGNRGAPKGCLRTPRLKWYRMKALPEEHTLPGVDPHTLSLRLWKEFRGTF